MSPSLVCLSGPILALQMPQVGTGHHITVIISAVIPAKAGIQLS